MQLYATKMASTEILLKDLEKTKLITLVFNLQNKLEKFIDKFGKPIGKLITTVENLATKFKQVESTLLVTKTVNDV